MLVLLKNWRIREDNCERPRASKLEVLPVADQRKVR